ncbi:MAG: class I adenylate-forming enzyme family protein [Bryobacteraceae bacterium]
MLYAHTLGRAARYTANHLGVVDGERRYTYGELATRVERLAGRLTAMGFSPGDRLAFLLPNGCEFIELTFACARTGILAVPINTRYSVPEIDAVLADCTPRGLVRHESLPKPTVAVPWEVVLPGEPLEGSSDPAPGPLHDPAALLGLFYTSGTTGRAKGVMLTHANLLANMYHFNSWAPMRYPDVWLHAAPMFHVADFPTILICAASGLAQATIPRFDPRLFCEAVAREGVTATVLIPTMINFLSQCPDIARNDISSLKTILYGGSPMAPDILRRAREKLPGVRLSQGYGLTETAPLLTVLADEDHAGERILSCGQPPVGVELRIVDPEGNPVPVGTPGEIVARGANIMKGYWNQPEATRAALVDGWFHTGDIAREDSDGFFYIVDRSKDMIVTGGENVYSSEVEAAVYSHPAIKECAVIGIPDPEWGEIVAACVVVKDGAALAADDLVAHCRSRLANYKLPRRVEFIDGELPKSGSGKILKRTLREPFWKDQTRRV